MGIVSSAHERARALVIADIVAEARRQLATEGAAGLSVRAVARSLGMASSAVYRYVPSRDELLTTLIVEAYDALGAHVEAAASGQESLWTRWRSACHAVRGWALEHPQEYALIYGSPVPGYRAPSTTVTPASRVVSVLTGILLEAQRTGRAREVRVPTLPPSLSASMHDLARSTEPQLPPATIAAGLVAWAMLFGQVSFEVFGRLDGLVHDTEALFDHTVTTMADLVGLTAT